MKVGVPILRSLGMVLTLASLGPGSARAQAITPNATASAPAAAHPTSSPKKDASEKSNLPPELEKALQDLDDKAKEEKTGVWHAEMHKRIDDIVAATGLSDSGRKALSDAADQAVAASVDVWGQQSLAYAQKQFGSIPRDQLARLLDTLKQAAVRGNGMMTQDDGPIAGKYTAPQDQDVWTKALHQVLNPAQLTAWAQAQDKQKADVEKEISSIIKNGADRTKSYETNQVTAECKGIENTLQLSRDRTAQLESLGKSAVDKSLASWKENEEKTLLAMNELQRRPMMANGWYMGVNSNDEPTQQAVWKDGLARLLTADEKARLQADKDARKAKRQHVMGQILVLLLDDKLALTQVQRQKIEPLACRLVKDIQQLYPDDASVGGGYYSSDVFYNATTGAKEADLKPILDPLQLKRWQSLSSLENNSSDNFDAETGEAGNSEPETVERVISSYFYEKAESERKRELEQNTLKAEDIARVAGLSQAASAQLQAAAYGETEQSLTTWKWFTEEQIRSQLQDLTPQNVRQRLDSLQDFFFQRRFGITTSESLWDQAVESTLTPQQQEAWKKEADAREAYRDDAIAALALSELDLTAHLNSAQWAKLQPLVSSVLGDYNQGFNQFFAGMGGTPWYLAGSYTLIPLAGVDDQQLKSTLSKEQMDLWTGSQDYANAINLWQVVRQMRSQRVHHDARTLIED